MNIKKFNKTEDLSQVKFQEQGKTKSIFLSVEEIEKQHGTLLSAAEVAKRLNVCPNVFYLYLKDGCFQEFYFIFDKSKHSDKRIEMYYFPEKFIPDVEKELNEHWKKYESLCSNNQLVVDDYFARVREISFEELLAEIKAGDWDHAIYDTCISRSGRKKYFFKKEVIGLKRYQTLKQIAKLTGVADSTLYRYVELGELVQPKNLENTKLWDVEEVKRKLPLIQKKYLSKKGSYKEIKVFDLLSEELKSLIEEYLYYRQNTHRFMSIDGIKFFKISEKEVENHRRALAAVFFKIICARCGIKVEKIRNLTEDEFRIYDASDFKVTDIQPKDIASMNRGWKKSTQESIGRMVRPFLSWIVQKEKLECDELNLEDWRRFRAIEKNFEYIIPMIPFKDSRGIYNENKVFLTREQIILAYNLIRKNPSSNKPFQQTVMWMVSCFTGVRPEEIIQLRIYDFQLDKQNGYLLRTDERGYGKLMVAKERSKGGYSPSHPKLGLLLVPRLVILINKYLERLYRYQKPGTDGWFFRPFNYSPEIQYSKVPDWITDVRYSFDFLEEEKRGYVELKTGRRSMNNLIRLYTTINDPTLESNKQRAAEVQMRHNISKKSGSVNDGYTDEISAEQYYAIIDEALNFPWDLEEVYRWEIQKGLRKPEETVMNEAVTFLKNDIEIIKSQLSDASEEYERLKKVPVKEQGIGWLKKKSECKKRMKKLEEYLKNAEQGLR